MLDTDSWIMENSPIEPERLHALGTINFYWSQSEFGFFCIFSLLCGLDVDRTAAAFGGLSATAQIAAVKALSKTMPSQILFDKDGMAEKLRDAIFHAAELFDANRKNRNAVVHAYFFQKRDAVAMQNRAPKKSWDFKDIPCSLGDLRATAMECKVLCAYLSGLLAHLFALNRPQGSFPRELPPLPNKPLPPPSRT
jgi:hypothetical protein